LAHLLVDADLEKLLGWSGAAWAQTFNPRTYGAKGDGAADDTPAINAALAAVPSSEPLIFC